MNMKKMVFVAVLVCVGAAGHAWCAEKTPARVLDFTNSVLTKYGSDQTVVTAVKNENVKGKTLEQIKSVDSKWIKSPGVDSFMKEMLENNCSKFTRKICDKYNSIVEVIVMDNKGANVAMSGKTTDYWQGDEAKFIKSFNNGAGVVFPDDVKFDESSQTYVSAVSVPVVDGGKTIGVICFMIDVDKIK